METTAFKLAALAAAALAIALCLAALHYSKLISSLRLRLEIASASARIAEERAWSVEAELTEAVRELKTIRETPVSKAALMVEDCEADSAYRLRAYYYSGVYGRQGATVKTFRYDASDADTKGYAHRCAWELKDKIEENSDL